MNADESNRINHSDNMGENNHGDDFFSIPYRTDIADRVPAPVFDIANVKFEWMYNPAMSILFEYDGFVNEGRLKKALELAIFADPYLSSKYCEIDDTAYWIREESAKFKEYFKIHEYSGNVSEIYDEHSPVFDVFSAPQMKIDIFRSDISDTIVFTGHHGYADAHGILDTAHFILDIYVKLSTDPMYKPKLNDWYLRDTKDLLNGYSQSEIERACADYKVYSDNWTFPYEYIGDESKGMGIERTAVHTIPAEKFLKIKAFGKKHGATVNDMLLAAMHTAFMKITNLDSVKGSEKAILTAGDIRSRFGFDNPNHFMNISIVFYVMAYGNPNSNFVDILDQIVAQTAHVKSNDYGIACIKEYNGMLKNGIGYINDFYKSTMNNYSVLMKKNPVFSNIGVLDRWCYPSLEGKSVTDVIHLKNAVFMPVVCHPYGYSLIVSTYANNLSLISGYTEGPYKREKIEFFLKVMEDVLSKAIE